MKVVILCGGKGTRMGNDELPKALLPIGGRPILWHIMSIYAYYGFCEFILCLGHKGNAIRNYFSGTKGWKITFAETGLNTATGGRIKKVQHLIKEKLFFATYGDGMADVNLKKLLEFHKIHNKIATITVAKPYSPFGIVGVDSHTQMVTHFEEKPILDHWINAGFFVFDKDVFDFINGNDILEKDSFSRLVAKKGMAAYKHYSFWQCMDTYKDNLKLNELWLDHKAPWALWREKKNG